MRDFFGESPYIIHSLYSDNDCSTFEYAVGFLATNSCLGGNVTAGLFYQSSLNADGSAMVVPYYVPVGSKGSMTGDSSYSSTNVAIGAANKDEIVSHSCVLYDFFTTDSVNSLERIGIVVAAVIVAVGILWALICRRTKGKRNEDRSNSSSAGPGDTDCIAMEGQRGLWNDEAITTKRISRDKVTIKKLIRRGSYGEVYSGVYNRQKVAIKMLLASARSNLQHVNAFLAEAKIAAVMDHPRIVSFVGVAWDSLSDLCMAIEFMNGGDPRALLNKYEASSHPVGFDRLKATTALQVCHALTYLHSLSPPMIHRDLKSRNILLTKTLEAKLTDFGVSRELLDRTMTVGVGTSLWMAPEVMFGERYDDNADMFSFGVVLSELDVHTLPYAQARKRSRESEGRELVDATLLHRIVAGEARVEFSYFSPRSIVKLGLRPQRETECSGGAVQTSSCLVEGAPCTTGH